MTSSLEILGKVCLVYHIYRSDNSVQESFSFSAQQQQRTIGSLTVPPANIKWSIERNSSFPQGLNLSYSLSLANGRPLSSAFFFTKTTSNGITTHYLNLEGNLFAVLEIEPFALVDNISLGIDHSLQRSSSTTTLELQFPPFNCSLFYDPSLGLAQLLGGRGGAEESLTRPPLYQ